MLKTYKSTDAITVWRSGAVGDFVLTLPALSALKQYGQGCPMRIVAQPSTGTLFKADLSVDSGSSWLAPLHAPKLQSHSLFDESSLLLVYGKAEGALFENARTHLGNQAIFWDPKPPRSFRNHMTDHLLEPLRGLIDLSTLDRRPVIELGKGELINAQKNYSIPTVIAHPGSSSPSKSWSLERFIQWAQLLKKANIEVGFIYGPIERERGIVLPSNLPHFSPPDLRTLATILAQTQLFVGNDSGPGHIAAAVGTPTLSLFGSTNPTLWAPRHETNRVLMAPQGDVQKLSVESVLKATINALETAR